MSNKAVCMDIGGTTIKYASVNKNILQDYAQVDTPKDKNELLRLIEGIIKMQSNSFDSICIAIASPVENGIVKNPPNLPLKDFDLTTYVKKFTKSKVFIENDVCCVALAEHAFASRKDNFVVLSLGTGIGGGIFISGKPYSGKANAGELGHMMIKGKYLEDLWKETRSDIKRKNNWKLMSVDELLASTDSKFADIKERMLEYLSQAIVTIINSFDPEGIILSGGIRSTSTSLIAALDNYIRKYAFLEHTTPVTWTTIEHPELIGAGLLPSLS